MLPLTQQPFGTGHTISQATDFKFSATGLWHQETTWLYTEQNYKICFPGCLNWKQSTKMYRGARKHKESIWIC